MLNAYVLETDRKKEEIIGLLKDYKAIAVRAELALLTEFANYSFQRAGKDFKEKINVAREFRMEWMCRLACTKNINNAIDFCAMERGIAGIISADPIPKNVLDSIGKIQKNALDGKIMEKILGIYSIPKIALEKYDLQEILREKSAVSFLE